MATLDPATALVVPFENLRMTDVEAVGGKNASLGEMISQLAASGVAVPGGFATTAHAFRRFLAQDGLDARIAHRLAGLDTDDVRALAAAGADIRGWIEATPFPGELHDAIAQAFGDRTGCVHTTASARGFPATAGPAHRARAAVLPPSAGASANPHHHLHRKRLAGRRRV